MNNTTHVHQPQYAVLRDTNLFARGAVFGGALSGICAGSGMLGLWLFLSAVAGAGFLFPLRLIAGSFLGVEALVGGAGTVLTGLGLHFLVATGLGVVFSLITQPRRSMAPAFFEGLAFGITVWAVMTYLAVPSVDPILGSRLALAPVWWFIAHVFFGGLLTVTPLMRRWVIRRRPLRDFAP